MPTVGGAAAEQPASAALCGPIVAHALELLDERGLNGVNLTTVAQRAGMTEVALSAQFPQIGILKDAMARSMADASVEDLEPPLPLGWRERLTRRARAARSAMISRRDGAHLFAALGSFPDFGETRDALILHLCESGFSGFDARAAIQLVDRFVLGWAIADRPTDQTSDGELPADFDGQLDTLLAGIAVTRASGGTSAKHRMFQASLWIFLRNARDSANIAFSRADHINELDRRILLMLQSQGEQTLAAISTANGVDKAQVSRAIKRLSQVDLILRSGIRSPLRLSNAGRQLADRFVRLAELRNRELTFGIGDDQLVDLFGVLELLLGRAMALYEQERKLAAAAHGKDAEIDFRTMNR